MGVFPICCKLYAVCPKDIFFFLFVTDVVRFDNTYSWTRSKTVHYSIEVLEPSKDELPMDEPIVWRDDNTFSIRL